MASLSSLQTEREKLRAANAREAYERDLAETVQHSDVQRAALACRNVMQQALDRVALRMLDEIAREHDETRVHFLMSDVVHDELTAMGARLTECSVALPPVGEQIRRGATPRPLLTVSQWADRYRWIQSGTNAPGRWNTALTPYLREIGDALSEHSPVRQVTFIKSSGVGGTELLMNWIGYVMHHLQNKDLLLVVPTLELRDRSFNPRISKMLDETPVLRELTTQASRNKSNRVDLLEYGARARIIKAGANSPDSLRSDHLPYVICDEADAFPWDVGGEGDPMTLIENRQRTFSRAKTYLVSTPTLENQSRIHQAYQRSDRRRYHVPCPHCGEFQTLEFPGGKNTEITHGLKWRVALPDANGEVADRIDQVTDAWYQCRHCDQRIDEGYKTVMLSQGRWIAERPGVKLYRGYHINALYAPTGLGLTWKHIAQKWLSCQGDTAELKAFINTYLGEVFSEQGDSIEASSLLMRLEDYAFYDRSILPLLLITAGVDVQKDRLEFTVVGWGEGEQGWTLEHIILPGDTAQQEVWDDLDRDLTDHGIQFACIDSGYNTSMVYAFCAKRRWCIATKGVTGSHRPLIEDERKRRQRLRARRRKGSAVEPIGVDQGKALLYARLKQPEFGPGYIHFPLMPAFDDEYFAQLAAEKLVTKFRGQRPIQEWVQTRPRNEALDCMILALAALRLSGRKVIEDTPPPSKTLDDLKPAATKMLQRGLIRMTGSKR